MPTHFVHLIQRSVAALPSSLGSNWLGLLFPFLVFLLTQAVSGFLRGWTHMKAHWKENLLIGLAVAGVAWAGLFCWCVVTTVDLDHQSLNARIRQIHNEKTATELAHENASKNLERQITALRFQVKDAQTDCAVKEGISQTLQKQNRDQQSTINGCLAQAMKLLTPEVLKITALLLENDTQNAALKTIKILLIANKTVTPVNMTIVCNAALQSGTVSILGSGVMAGGTSKISGNALQVNISTPAWGPTSPMVATLLHRGGDDFQCSFNPR